MFIYIEFLSYFPCLLPTFKCLYKDYKIKVFHSRGCVTYMKLLLFTEYAVNSVLFQRGLYPPETFKAEQQYGITLLISEDPQIKSFLNNLLTQSEGKIFLIMFISSVERKFKITIIN